MANKEDRLQEQKRRGIKAGLGKIKAGPGARLQYTLSLHDALPI